MKLFKSNTILALIILVISCFVFNPPIHEILTWDLFGHYIYLPLAFENHNMVLQDLQYLQQVNETYHVTPVFYQFIQTPDGTFFTKYTIGWALLQAPFYLLAEGWAHLVGVEADGFTYPYQVMVYIGAWFYIVLGLIFTRKVLLHFFSDKFTALLLLLLVFGTNLFFQYYCAVGQSNHFAFFLVAWLVWRIICFHKNPTTRNAVFFGAVWGLLVLVRPPDGIIGLLLFFWNVNSWQTMKEQLSWFFKTHLRKTSALAGAFFLALFPQMLYWYLSSGSWILNSYSNNNGEGFDFSDPYLFEFLFSFRKGWLLYTPLMIFAFAGAVIMLKKSAQGKAFSLIALLFLYVIASWTCWWYGASFGSRAALDMYPICIVLAGFALQHLFLSKWKGITITAVMLFVCLNLVQTYQMSYGILNHSFMTREYYFSTFLQFSPPSPEQNALLAFDREQVYLAGFEKGLKNYKSVYALDEKISPAAFVGSGKEYMQEYFIPVREYVHKSHAWVEIAWSYACKPEALQGTVFYVSAAYKNALYGWEGFEINDGKTKLDTVAREISFQYLTPNIRNRKDRLLFGAMNHSENTIYLTRRRIEFFEPLADYH